MAKLRSGTADEYVPRRLTVPGWLWGTFAAMTATLSHTLIDMHVGLWGETSQDITLIQGVNLVLTGAVFAWWLLAAVLAIDGDRWARNTLLLYAAVYATLLHGLIALIAAPPPSAAFPFQDIAHVASLISGAIAALSIRSVKTEKTYAGRRHLFITALVLILGSQAAGAVAFFLYTQ